MTQTDNNQFGNPIALAGLGWSRWFSGEATIVEWKSIRHWKCPKDECRGEMVFNGSVWPMCDPGYHHSCSECDLIAAITTHQYPFKVDADGDATGVP